MNNQTEVESENDTEIWALVTAVGMANKPEVQRIRAITAIARIGARIGGTIEKDKTDNQKAVEQFREREMRITEIQAEWEKTQVLGSPGWIIRDKYADVEVPARPDFLQVAIRTFNERHTFYEAPALVRLMGEMLAYAQKEKILDPSKKRNAQTFKEMLGRYSGNSSWGFSEDTEFIS